MTESPAQSYIYAGIPLTPNVIAELAKKLMRAPMFRRAELVAAVQEYHNANGGGSSGSNIAASAKKALQVLARDGLLEQTGAYGFWRWVVPPEPGEAADLGPGVDEVDEDAEDLELTDQTIIEGGGSGCVYVYYFPSYQALAELQHEDRWPVKIGMSAVSDARIRISEQQGTAMPEAPVLAYVRRIDTPHRLERCIHSILFYRGQHLEDAPGSEWFNSSPQEVKSLVDLIMSPDLQD